MKRCRLCLSVDHNALTCPIEIGDEMAAANEMISKGEAEVVCTGCHLYLTATLRDA